MMDDLERLRLKRMRELVSEEKMSEPIEVTDENFSEEVEKNKVMVVDCWADWCGPCKMLSPVIDDLAGEYAGKIIFGKLNVDANKQVPAEYQIMSIPTLLVFKDGELADRITGALPKPALKEKLDPHTE